MGGATAALAGYFLLLQAFVAALTCGMTVPVEAGPHFVLCQPSQPQGVAAEDPAGFSHDCPCVVCPSGDADLALGHAPGGDLGVAYTLFDAVSRTRIAETPALVDPARLGLAPRPRGPPLLST